jgi:hypothetical protein
MSAYVVIGDETTHIAGDPQCPECWEGYAETCPCGGLIHAAGTEADPDGPDIPAATRCDRCGRSEEEVH